MRMIRGGGVLFTVRSPMCMLVDRGSGMTGPDGKVRDNKGFQRKLGEICHADVVESLSRFAVFS